MPTSSNTGNKEHFVSRDMFLHCSSMCSDSHGLTYRFVFQFRQFQCENFMEPAPLSPVIGPSDDDRESDLDVEAALANPRAVPAKRGKRLPADYPLYIRSILGKQCACKKRNCFEKFTGREKFDELHKYRTEMRELHKLDQDRVETQFWN